MHGDGESGAPTVEICLLGPIQAIRDGGAVRLAGQKPAALLAILALQPGRVVAADRLVDDLWAGSAPQTAMHAVQVYVSQLRKALGPVIGTRAPGYVLELDPARVDAQRFAALASEGRETLRGGAPEVAEELLREALALWRGPALADLTYEPFAQSEIARLDADLALGRHVVLVPELEAFVRSQPLREHPRAQLMLALYS